MKRTRQTKTGKKALRTPIHEEVQEVEDLLRRPAKLGYSTFDPNQLNLQHM